LLLAATVAFAQGSAPLRLTLKQAVDLALQQNPYVILANLNVSQSRQDQAIARSGLLPQLAGNVSESVHRFNIETAFGSSIPGFTEHAGPYWVAQAGASFSAPVFDLTLWRRYRAAQSALSASQAQETAAREESVILVVSQYLGAQRAAAEVAAAQSRVDLAQALYSQAADLQKNGAGTGIDTLRANVQLQNEKQRLITARTSLDTALFGLARLLNVDPHRNIELADQVSFFETPAAAANETLERAWADRPEMRQIAAQERAVRLQAAAASEERLPKLSVSGYWFDQGLTPATVIPVYTYGASLDFPLFTGGRIQAEQAKSDLALRQLRQQEQDLRDRFQAGVANNIEVITAQDELARANDNQIAALYRYNQSRADLAHASGRMEALYAQ